MESEQVQVLWLLQVRLSKPASAALSKGRPCRQHLPLLLPSYTTLGLQIAQSRSHLYAIGPKVGILDLLGALRQCSCARQELDKKISKRSPRLLRAGGDQRRQLQGQPPQHPGLIALRQPGPPKRLKQWRSVVHLFEDVGYDFEHFGGPGSVPIC